MTQQSFFDDETQRQKQEAKVAEVDAKIKAIEERIRNGEAWLNKTGINTHPLYEKNKEVFRHLLEDRTRLIVEKEDILDHWHVCVMQLPPGATWGKGQHSIVKVLWGGQPTSDDEMTYEQLGKLIGDVGMVKEAMVESKA